MSASLVGSEMCIRDSSWAWATAWHSAGVASPGWSRSTPRTRARTRSATAPAPSRGRSMLSCAGGRVASTSRA
eukprot:7651318-Alexandrium_andersonii.AAC.1